MSFNVRFDTGEDGARGWRHRRTDVFDTIRAHDPDLISLQEPDASQWADICQQLAGYSPFGVFDDGSNGAEPHGGLFKAARFEGYDEGVFWLSETPSVPHSVSWDTDWEPRACGWTRLRDRATDRDLIFAATHFDTNPRGWLRSAITLHRELDAIARGTPTIVAGDFNCPAGSQAHRFLIEAGGYRDVWYEAGHSDAGVLTFHGFTGRRRLPGDPAAGDQWLRATSARVESSEPHNDRIDWILVRGALTCRDARIDYESRSGEPASDHYPVVALVEWTGLGN